MQEIRSSNPPVVTGICDPNKSGARHHRSCEKMFTLGKENECFRNENKKQQAIMKMLIEDRNKNTDT